MSPTHNNLKIVNVASVPEGSRFRYPGGKRATPTSLNRESYVPVCNIGAESHDYTRILNEAEVGDDLCDFCLTSGVHVERTYKGKTVGVECGCDEIVGYDDEAD